MARTPDLFRRAEARLWERSGVTPTERRVVLPSGGGVRIQEVGSGPPVLFVHGGAIAGTSWLDLAVALPEYRCILVDRPGCGLSDPIVGGPLRGLPALKDYADRLVPDLLDALGLERAVVAGTSYGGFFAFRGAAAAPDRVEKLIEYSWLIGAPNESVPFAARLGGIPGMQAMMARFPMSRSMVRTALRQFGLGRAIDSGAFDDLMLDWAHALLAHTDTMANDARSTPQVIRPIKGFDDAVLLGDDLLARLTMPVLLVWGECDPNGGADVARRFAPKLPDAKLVVVPDAEHAPWIDDLDTCVAATRDFLAS